MATDWETQYQKNETPWDKGGPSPALLEYLATSQVRGKVLAPGCGAGHDVRALAAHGAEVIGLDLAPSAIKMAQSFFANGGERYVCGNLFSLPPELRGAFNWVWEHTCFCAIDPSQRANYVEGVHTALALGGHLLAVFYLDPGNEAPNDGPPFEVTVPQLDALFLPKFSLVREWLPSQNYLGREKREWMRLMRRR